MYTKTITYTDYNGNERTEKFLFNLSKAEILEMELSTTGGFTEKLQKIIDAQDVPTMTSVFKELLLKSYGEKSDDGRRFIKSAELSKAFSETEAYSNFYMELVTNTDSAIEFINGVVPAEVAAEEKKEADKQKAIEQSGLKVVDHIEV